jgi:hypothetical protein
MFNSINHKTLLRLCLLCTLSICLWFFSGNVTSKIKTQNPGQFERQLPVTTSQLHADDGRIPVELRCENVELSAPNELEKLTCVITNNTSGYISAGALHTSITIEDDGKPLVISTYDTFDTFLHPDFREDHKDNLIAPGKEYRLNDLPASYREGAVIKGVAVEIDYIEFADKSMLGNNRSGSRIIGELRKGAAKYKNWLAQEYKRRGGKVEALVPLIDGTQPLPELEIQNAEQERGAIMYRKFSWRTYTDKGADGLNKHLKETSNSTNK